VLTTAQIGGIAGGGAGFLIIVVVVIILVAKRSKRDVGGDLKDNRGRPKRKHAETMQIPKYPTIPIDHKMKKNKKPARRSTILDLFGKPLGKPKKSNSKSSIMMNDV